MRFFPQESYFIKAIENVFSGVCIAWYKHSRGWENSRLRLGFASLSRILPTPLVFISGYANTENVFYCLNRIIWPRWSRSRQSYNSGEFFNKISFQNRFASFNEDEPLINYQDLLDRVKKAVTFLQGDDDQQIVISNKHLSLQTFINIDRNESLHVSESFRNASPCGSEIYLQVYLKVRESDSPFLLKRHSDSKEASAKSISTKQQSNNIGFMNRLKR